MLEVTPEHLRLLYIIAMTTGLRTGELQAFTRKHLDAKKVELAGEEEISRIFEDCDLGAEPPFGQLYDLPVIMDKALEEQDHIMFQASSHEKAIRMSMADYQKLAKPRLLEFSYHS